jgi:Protein of unknown function DUF262
MKDIANSLGESDSEEQFNFPPAERKVVTQSYDLSLQTLLEQWDGGLLSVPEIQREYIWDNGRSSRLIESLMLNIPVPLLYFSEMQDARYEIIDGHQRVKSIVRFLKNEFGLSSLGVLSEYRGMRFHSLPEREQRFLKMRIVRAVIISHESHPNMKFEIFERLNTGSISLNAQELRNSIFRGSLNRLLRELVKQNRFRHIIGTVHPRPRMVDEELVLRFFALRAGYAQYRPPLKRFMNAFMSENREMNEDQLGLLRQTFEKTIGHISAALGSSAFRVSDAKGNPYEKVTNRALFDAQMISFSWLDEGQNISARKPAVLERLAALYEDIEFLDAIRRATGDRARTRARVRAVVGALRDAGLEVTPSSSLEG